MFKSNDTPPANQKQSLNTLFAPLSPSLAEPIMPERPRVACPDSETEIPSSAKNETNLRTKENYVRQIHQHQLLELLPVGAIELNEQGTITHQNAAAMHIIGHNWTGQSWQACYAQLSALIAANSTHPAQQLDIQIHPQPNSTGKIVFIQNVNTKHLQKSHIEKREKTAKIEQMTASLAHQLRTPLSSAMLYVGHLAKPSLTPADRIRLTQKIQERLHHLEKVIHNTLRSTQGQTIQNKLVSINSLLFDAAQTLHAQILKKNQTIDIKILTPDRQLYANQQALIGALISLLENAADASPPEQIITLHAETTHTHCKIHVDNIGQAIDPALSTQIFEPFFTTRPQGTGLGLSIAQQVAEEMGGHLHHTRTADRKTRFTFTFPCPTHPE